MAITVNGRWPYQGISWMCLATAQFSPAFADEVPVLVNDTKMESDGFISLNLPATYEGARQEPNASAIYPRNRSDIQKTLSMEPEETIPVLRNRLKDPQVPMTLRVLYAGILACLADTQGRNFLIQRVKQSATEEEAQDACWVMGHLHWFPRRSKDGNFAIIDMRWAEEVILETLKSRSFVTTSPPREKAKVEKVESAVLDGGFHFLLAGLKSEQAYPVLVNLYESAISHRWLAERVELLSALGSLNDKRSIPLLVRVARSRQSITVVGYIDNGMYQTAIRALADMNAPEALPIMLAQLDRWETYRFLRRYEEPTVLVAIKEALPKLRHGYARGEARLFILDREGEDRLPALLRFARDPTLKSSQNVVDLIQATHDERSLPFAIELLRTSPDLHRRYQAINILGSFKLPEATKALIQALDVDFDALAEGKAVMRDNKKWLRSRIAKHLKQMTGQNFGDDQTKWMAWYDATYPVK